MRRAGLAALLAAAALSAPAAAQAREASAAEVRALAARAADDPAALRELRAIDEVDGRAVDLRSAAGDGPGLRSRLRVLAEPSSAPADSARARAEARRILREDRFHEARLPRPLKGFFEWLGQRIRPIGERLEDVLDELASWIPGGRSVTLAVLAGLALLLFTALSGRILRPRALRSERALARAVAGHGPTAAELDRAAQRAEAEGELDLAVRLRFRAGLVALQERGTLDSRSSITTREIARKLRSPDFDRLAHEFEEIAYGGRAAAGEDVEAQREGWRSVLGGAPR